MRCAESHSFCELLMPLWFYRPAFNAHKHDSTRMCTYRCRWRSAPRSWTKTGTVASNRACWTTPLRASLCVCLVCVDRVLIQLQFKSVRTVWPDVFRHKLEAQCCAYTCTRAQAHKHTRTHTRTKLAHKEWEHERQATRTAENGELNWMRCALCCRALSAHFAYA